MEQDNSDTKTLYACAVDWQHEVGEASDLEGEMPFYSSIDELKSQRPCWKQCGIVELKIQFVSFPEPQNLFDRSLWNKDEDI